MSFKHHPSCVGKHPAYCIPVSSPRLICEGYNAGHAAGKAEGIAIGRAAATATLDAIGDLLSLNGCDCGCDHHHEEHDEDCVRCLACKIDAVLTAPRADITGASANGEK